MRLIQMLNVPLISLECGLLSQEVVHHVIISDGCKRVQTNEMIVQVAVDFKDHLCSTYLIDVFTSFERSGKLIVREKPKVLKFHATFAREALHNDGFDS